MAEHGWPGNVRELRNFVDRAGVMFAGRTIGADEAGALLVRRGRVSAIETRALWAATAPEAAAAPAADEVVVPIRGRSPSAPPPQMTAASRSRSRRCSPRSSAAISSRR